MRLRTAMDVGATIRDRRRSLGLRQGELADRVGVSRLWISEVERGKPGASLDRVLRTLAFLHIDLIADTGETACVDAPDVATPDINAIVEAARRREKA
jgi:HTH-type transcriptional regulator/antitoxin HipB